MATGQSCDVEWTDEELLDRFVSRRDAAAFEALVHRYGPMVLGVCRRLLQHLQDAEDAFQATFLVLVRKAASLGQRELLGNWLYGVAYRTALDARTATLRRRKREKQVSSMPEPEVHEDSDEWRDLRSFLDQELNRLPDKYRIPIVLCDLEGKTRQDVAERLDLPVGTLSGRLTTARKILAKRLARRGLALSGGALIAALSPSTASAAVPAPLVTSTVQAATAGAVSSHAVALAEGVMKAMLMKKLMIATAVLLTVLAGTAAVVVHADRDASGAAKVLKLQGRGRFVAWSPDGKTLAVREFYEPFYPIRIGHGGEAIRLWDVAKGLVKQTLAESPNKAGPHFGDVVFSPDGKMIATTVREAVIRPNGGGSIRDTIRVWDAKTFALKHTLDAEAGVHGIAFSPDGKWLAGVNGGSRPRVLSLWKAEKGALERTLETGEAIPTHLAFSADGKALVIGGQKPDFSGEVQLWDAQTWKLKQALKHDDVVMAVAFSANGKIVASASADNFVRLWDAHTGKLIHSLKGGAYNVAFSPDSRTVAAGWKDGRIRLWDVQTGELKEKLKGHAASIFSAIWSIAFSPDGKTLASTGQDETVRLWQINQRAASDK
jgi:RNA polymerase sigma factor (sigma-70 family)